VISLNTPPTTSSSDYLARNSTFKDSSDSSNKTTANGLIAVYHNHALAMWHPNMTLRMNNDVGINAVDFTTFFGGSDESWSAKKSGKSYFRNMRVRNDSFDSVYLYLVLI
jgi:hypothetical protein